MFNAADEMRSKLNDCDYGRSDLAEYKRVTCFPDFHPFPQPREKMIFLSRGLRVPPASSVTYIMHNRQAQAIVLNNADIYLRKDDRIQNKQHFS